MEHYFGVAKEQGITDDEIGAVQSVVMAVSVGQVRVQFREARQRSKTPSQVELTGSDRCEIEQGTQAERVSHGWLTSQNAQRPDCPRFVRLQWNPGIEAVAQLAEDWMSCKAGVDLQVSNDEWPGDWGEIVGDYVLAGQYGLGKVADGCRDPLMGSITEGKVRQICPVYGSSEPDHRVEGFLRKGIPHA